MIREVTSTNETSESNRKYKHVEHIEYYALHFNFVVHKIMGELTLYKIFISINQ